MSTVIAATCSCGSIGRSDLRQCPEHFHIWRGDKRLASVGRIIRECWPKPEKMPPEDVLENARLRGSEVDLLFAQYVRGELKRIPAGTRQDAANLLQKLVKWYDKQGFKTAEAQVLLGGEDHGGVLDFRFDDVTVDLKATYNVDDTHRMQVAGYSLLAGSPLESNSRHGMILHVTERYPEPRLVPLECRDYEDWNTMLAHWRMLQRRTA